MWISRALCSPYYNTCSSSISFTYSSSTSYSWTYDCYLQGGAWTRIDHCVLVLRGTTSELEMRDLDHPVICRCRKHRQNTTIIIRLLKILREHKWFKSLIPVSTRLYQGIKRFLQLIDKVFFSRNNKTIWWVHINISSKFLCKNLILTSNCSSS
jgi:hypothetical protein